MEDKFVGKRLDGRYEIHQLIGTGGMAHVYKAYDKQDDRWVAIKILKAEYVNNEEFLRRFRNESKAIAMLSHPNIVKVFDVSFGDKIQYIVMEYISGITLKDFINKSGVLTWKDSVYFAHQILQALEHAHEKGVIHRDIKPQNIILLKDGSIKVTDFGIARFTQNETQTMTDRALGSVHYISPEQARGDYTNNKADIYSLGVILYEMLTGKLPFDADSAVSVALMQIQSIAVEPRVINPDIPVGLEEITMKAMEKNTALRFQSAKAMLSDIDQFRKNPDIVFNYQEDISETRHVDIPVMVSKPVTTGAVVEEERKIVKEQIPVYNDNYEYEEEFISSKKQAKFSMVITGVVAALVVTIIGFLIFLAYDYSQKPDVDEVIDEMLVPNFIGMIYQDEVEGNLAYKNLNFVIKDVVDESKEIGEIIRQSPKDGINVKFGKEITIYVVKEQDEGDLVEIPPLIGLSETEAHNALVAVGLVPVSDSVNNEKYPAGQVVNSQPAQNTKVVPGTIITMYVSKGPVELPVAVPNLFGETLESAKQMILDAGLTVGETIYEESEEDADIVIGCTPETGDRVSPETVVDIIVSKGGTQSKTIQAYVPLPDNVSRDLEMKIFLNGALHDTKIVNPSLTTTYGMELYGKSGKVQFVVFLDGKQYLRATADFDDELGSFDIENVYEYIFDEEPSGQ